MLAEANCQGSAAILVAGIVAASAGLRRHLALVDASDCFSPDAFALPDAAALFERLLWVRCHSVAQTIQAADLLLRDGNLPLVVLDLQGSPVRELQKQPASVWYRLRALAERSQSACLALTPCRSVAAAQLRLEIRGSLTLDTLEVPCLGRLDGQAPLVIRQRQAALSHPHYTVAVAS